MSISKPLLITGATGKQGRALINKLLTSRRGNEFDPLLALTRNPTSPSAQSLTALSPKIKLVQGDLSDVPQCFSAALRATNNTPIHGIFAVLVPGGGGGQSPVTEEQYGKALIDESLKHKVKHFVYTSVDRGGDEKSWSNETDVPHFASKCRVERYLRDRTAAPTAAGASETPSADGNPNSSSSDDVKEARNRMQYTIFRPVAFFDNWAAGLQGRVFMTALQEYMPADKRLQWVACSDIGWFAAQAFLQPEKYMGKAIGLAGDEMTNAELQAGFERLTKEGMAPTYGFIGKALMYVAKELRLMTEWFAREGYGADVKACREENPDMLDLRSWLASESKFTMK
ncbi:MAG: hypothetical protein M1828_006780 [Chrysothrix sp. TS-e1954]|nr:MAG: hypothetical protein M1828_006780 [Chrysothrix sp. TS-e1954]